MTILGISAYYHDSAAALLKDGRLAAAAQEERFSRKKHDSGFPGHAVTYCLSEGGVAIRDLDAIAFYDKPLLKFERLLETYLAYAPRGVASFYTDREVGDCLDSLGAKYQVVPPAEMVERVAALLAEENVVGWFQGRMEFGPRALGNRSILGDPRSPTMQSVMNLKIKYRKSFRPFAPSITAERVSDYSELQRPRPYMRLVALVRAELRAPLTAGQRRLAGLDKLKAPRSAIPAVTHVD